MDWFYCHDYSIRTVEAENFLDHSALVYAIADKYEVRGLKTRVLQEVSAYLRGDDDDIVKDYIESIPTVWTSTPSSDRSLRNIYIEHLLCHRNYYFADEGIIAHLKDVQEFARDTLLEDRKLSNGTESCLKLGVKYYCLTCSNIPLQSRDHVKWACWFCGGRKIISEYQYE